MKSNCSFRCSASSVLTPVSLAEPQQQASGAGASAGTNGADAASPIFTADINAAGIMVPARGRAIERGGEFVVFEGSTAFRRETPGITSSAADKRKLLIETGVLVPDVSPDLYRFAKNVSFSSPTGASAAIAGRSDRDRKLGALRGTGVPTALGGQIEFARLAAYPPKWTLQTTRPKEILPASPSPPDKPPPPSPPLRCRCRTLSARGSAVRRVTR